MLYHCSRHFWAFTAVEQCVAGEPRALECTHALVPSHCLQGKGWGVERPTDRRRFRGQATHSPSLPERLQARIHTQTHEKPMLRAAYACASVREQSFVQSDACCVLLRIRISSTWRAWSTRISKGNEVRQHRQKATRSRCGATLPPTSIILRALEFP